MQCTLIHCTVLYCTVLHCSALYCTALCYTALYCTAVHYNVLYCIVLYCTLLHCAILHCTVLHCAALCSNVLAIACSGSRNFENFSDALNRVSPERKSQRLQAGPLESVSTRQSTECGRMCKTYNQSNAPKWQTLNDKENIGDMELWAIMRSWMICTAHTLSFEW